jgi:hypothetical protein
MRRPFTKRTLVRSSIYEATKLVAGLVLCFSIASRLVKELLIEFRRFLDFQVLGFVMIEPKLRMLFCHQIRDALHRRQRFFFAVVVLRHQPLVEAPLEMRRVTAQDHRSRFRKPYQQRLVARRMPRCEEQRQTSVAEYVLVTFDLLHGMLRVNVHRILSVLPLVFGFLNKQRNIGKEVDVAGVVRMSMRESH